MTDIPVIVTLKFYRFEASRQCKSNVDILLNQNRSVTTGALMHNGRVSDSEYKHYGN